jgi:hypothetical protein
MSQMKTSTGIVFNATRCRDDWPTMRTQKVLGQQLHMQLPAIRAYRLACREFADRSGWTPARIKRTGGRPILLTGSWRSCDLQRQLHASDPGRFADPDGSLHPQGLAIDINTQQPDFDKAHAALDDIGWHRARPDDEPWHHSWGYSA